MIGNNELSITLPKVGASASFNKYKITIDVVGPFTLPITEIREFTNAGNMI